MGRKADKVKVVYFNRKPRPLGNFSIETFYRLVREYLQPPFEPVYCEMPFFNDGIFKRLGNAIYCYFNRGDINHITGDIHYVAAFLPKKRTILTVLDCGMLHDSKGLKFSLFLWLWFKMPIKKSTRVVAISNATKTDVIKYTGCSPDKIEVIYVSINQMFVKNPKKFNQENPRILQIGTAHNKNLERTIKALQGIPSTLVIVGKVDEHIVRLLDQCQVHHEIINRRISDEEMLAEYQKCDMLTFISTLEGFGMPIVEANATGRPVITSNITSMPEVATDAALLVDPYSIEAMRKGYLKIINDNTFRETLIENGFQNCDRFTIFNITNQYMELYKKVLSEV